MNREEALLVVKLFGDLVFISQIFVVLFAVVFLANKFIKKNKSLGGFLNFFKQNALPLSFLVALTATVGSLFFSEIAHFTPCKLCWYQRIAMYPQVIILGIATLRNDFAVARYIIPVSVIGLIIAIYHYALQMSPIPLPCSDEVANCALKQIGFYGYITIPLMAATAFLMIIVFMLISQRKK